MSDKVIGVEDLTRKYGDLMAVDGISFEVFRGEVFSLVGPNGSGKTTTVEVLECLRTPTSGSAEVFGLDVAVDEEEIKRRIGVVPQEFNTFNRLSVEENVSLISKIYGTEENLKRSLEKMNLWGERDKKFGDLSGGMKRRVGIAMALVSDPELLFLDEPTTGLDPQARRQLWGILKRLGETGVTIFLTTHYMEEVEELSDRASIMLGGRLLSTDTVEGLVSRYGGKVKVVVSGEGKADKIMEKFTEEVSVDEGGEVVGFFENKEQASRAQLSLYEELSGNFEIDLVEPSMEDVFLSVAGGRIDESGELVT